MDLPSINIIDPVIEKKPSCNPNEEIGNANELGVLSIHENILTKQTSSSDQIYNELRHEYSGSPEETAKRHQLFASHFGHRNHKISTQPDSLIELEDANPNYDTLKIIHGRVVKDDLYREMKESANSIIGLLRLRENYAFNDHQDYDGVGGFVMVDPETGEPQITWNKRVEPLPILVDADIHQEDGVHFTTIKGESIVCLPTMMQFVKDLLLIMDGVYANSVASFCYKRIKFLEQKYKMHEIFNHQYETTDQKAIRSKDFYNVFKVDTHIHHAAAMSAKHLLTFIKTKLDKEGDIHVNKLPNGTKIRLSDYFNEAGLKSSEISLNILDVQADKSMYKRFDRFNNKYNPLGQPKLREIFLKSDNYIRGRYLAELTKQLIDKLEDGKYVGCEWRVSIYGKSMEEWHKLCTTKPSLSQQNGFRVRWMIQIPRLYAIYRKGGLINNFQEMIDNIFRPLFDITINPTMDPFLYQALFQIVGFDTVDDESLYENFSVQALKTKPKDWVEEKNPPYAYWTYYIYANLYSLNALRQSRGLNTFKFRPHCGEAGDIDHLATAYLISDGINHGLELNKSPVLTYLYYLKQIGLAMSPVSNNKLFCRYQQSPFRKYFEIGMNVTLSTDDPLILHLTDEPLIEEYAIASQVFDLSSLDLAEIARNSVRQSGFEEIVKEYWLGKDYHDRIKATNHMEVNNLPNTRFLYRKSTLNEEYMNLEKLLDETQ